MRARWLVLGLVVCAGCAPRVAPPPLPAALAYPEFVYPVVPPALASEEAARVDAGWRFLQTRNLAAADAEFGAAIRGAPALYPARAGTAYVALAREQFDAALAAFDAALRAEPAYVPALVGRGQTLLAVKREPEALDAFEAALAVDPSLAGVRQRVEVLRFRSLQERIEGARAAAAAGRLDEAAAAYARALEASPDSAFLHRERGAVERRRGRLDAALTHFRRAAELDPSDTSALVQVGELLETQGDAAGADAAYERVLRLDPGSEVAARRAALAERSRDAALPEPFRAIPAAPQITRGDLAALVGVRFGDVLGTVQPREIVLTDVTGHWAAPWITEVARTGVIEPYPNHTFQPAEAVTRADLAVTINRLLALMAVDRPALRPYLTARPRIDDMPAGHASYPAASAAVASGIMPLGTGARFEPGRGVTGEEASAVILRLRDRASLGP